MEVDSIEEITTQGESQTVEFKKSLTQLKGAMESLCAFLNTEGGTIIIGANQRGEFIGQDISDNSQQEIANEITKIEPFPNSLNIHYSPIMNSSRKLIIISCQTGANAPYTYDGRAFYRNQSSTMRMPQLRYQQLLRQRDVSPQLFWESHPFPGATIEDLDHLEVQKTLEIAVNINRLDPKVLSEPLEDSLMRLDLVKQNQVTNAAMVLFAHSANTALPQCCIKLARFRGNTEHDGFIENQTVQGNAFQLIKAANEFIMRHLPVTSLFDESQFERRDEPTLPILVLREALSNAICHRDYSTLGGTITIAIFDDRMELWNNGSLPQMLSLDDLTKKHKSYLRNHAIAHIFYLRRLVESWGTGTTRMIALCKDQGIPIPVFDEYAGGVSVTFTFKHPIGNTHIDDQHPLTLTVRQQQLLDLFKHYQQLSTPEILEKLTDPPSDRMIRKDLTVLRNHGHIQLIGHGKNAAWILIA